MINLAGFRYRDVFADRQGPIERVETSNFTVEGRRMFLANSYLRADLLPARPKNAVYSNATGSGTHDSPMVARFMAISEALERWAYAVAATGDRKADYAFDVDPMSNGMAAFPGLFARQARRKAYLEAVERFSLVAWWEGLLPAVQVSTEWDGVNAAVIWAAEGEVVAILHKKTAEGAYAYGHGAGADFTSACQGAVVEMARHEYVIKSYRLARACGCSIINAPSDQLERRSVFFASEEGHEHFLWRLHSKPSGGRLVRRLAYDGEIKGPWGKYADVWRVAFHPVSKRFVSNDEHYFLW